MTEMKVTLEVDVFYYKLVYGNAIVLIKWKRETQRCSVPRPNTQGGILFPTQEGELEIVVHDLFLI